MYNIVFAAVESHQVILFLLLEFIICDSVAPFKEGWSSVKHTSFIYRKTFVTIYVRNFHQICHHILQRSDVSLLLSYYNSACLLHFVSLHAATTCQYIINNALFRLWSRGKSGGKTFLSEEMKERREDKRGERKLNW